MTSSVPKLNKKQNFGLVILVLSVTLSAILTSKFVPEKWQISLWLATIPATVGGIMGATFMVSDRQYWFQAILAGILANLSALVLTWCYLGWRQESVFALEFLFPILTGFGLGFFTYRQMVKPR